MRGRAFTEDRARDSLENLLFGLCRFYELTGRYPDFVVVRAWAGSAVTGRFNGETKSAVGAVQCIAAVTRNPTPPTTTTTAAGGWLRFQGTAVLGPAPHRAAAAAGGIPI